MELKRSFSCIDKSGNIYRFNGTQWTTYDSTISPYLKRGLEILAVDEQNRVWLQVRQPEIDLEALGMFDGDSMHIYTMENSGISNNLVSSAAIDASGRVWIGHYGSGVSVFDPEDTTIPTPVLPRAPSSDRKRTISFLPCCNALSIQLPSGTGHIAIVELFDVRGKLIEKRNLKYTGAEIKRIFPLHVASGTYCCRVQAGSAIETARFTAISK